MSLVISGALVAAYLTAGLFFLRFHRDTRDRLFLIFGIAFWVLALQRAALSLMTEQGGNHTYVYLLRLVAFLLILGAIIDKNRTAA